MQVTDTTGDELPVLGTKIEHGDELGGAVVRHVRLLLSATQTRLKVLPIIRQARFPHTYLYEHHAGNNINCYHYRVGAANIASSDHLDPI